MNYLASFYNRIGAGFLIMLWGCQQALAVNKNQSLGDIGTHVSKSGTGIGKMLWVGCLVVGFIIVISGLAMVARSHKNREGAGGPLLMIAVGSVMMAVPVVIGIMQTTAFGSSDTSDAFGQIGLG